MDSQKWEEIRRKARKEAGANFAAKASSLTHLTDEEINEIAPTPLDREKFSELMAIVKDTTKSNEAKAQAIKNMNDLAQMAVKVIEKLI